MSFDELFGENRLPLLYAVAVVLTGMGFWARLPRAQSAARAAGIVLLVVGLGLFFGLSLPGVPRLLAEYVFIVLAVVTITSAAATVTMRNPVYSAIWFALMLLTTGGLFLFQGAQFLGMATVTVYAGAILVTFLFLVMLANPKGQAYYDRLSWEAWISATAGAAMIGILTITLSAAFAPQEGQALNGPAAEALADSVLAADHVALLGQYLFGKHLVAVEVAGALLFAALVGATAIVSERPRARRVEGGTP